MKYAILTIFLFVRTLFQWLHHPRPYRSMQAFEIMAILIDVSMWLPTMMNVVQMNNSLRDNIVWHNLNYHYHHWSETWHIWIKFFILTILKLLVRYVLITFDQYNSFSTFFCHQNINKTSLRNLCPWMHHFFTRILFQWDYVFLQPVSHMRLKTSLTFVSIKKCYKC